MHKIDQNANITSDLLSKYPKTRVLKNTHYYVLPNRERERTCITNTNMRITRLL